MSRQAHDEAADWITAALQRGALKHQFYRHYTLEDIASAHEATESMSQVGKVILDIE
jgi:NADPH:quinone reductase-like Zn-dependent oxidoreductase